MSKLLVTVAAEARYSHVAFHETGPCWNWNPRYQQPQEHARIRWRQR